jgi:predicted Rossmann fold flavoprotein
LSEHFDVIVIGGGPAGIMSALAAAAEGSRVLILEAKDRIGGKIMVSGNGRCNFSNTAISAGAPDFLSQYHNAEFAASILLRCDSSWLRDLFEHWGMAVVDQDGWLFPATRYAGSVLEVLLRELKRSSVVIKTQCVAADLSCCQDSKIILACGFNECSSSILGNIIDVDAQLPYTEFRPILHPLNTEKSLLEGLDGLRAVCRLNLLRDGKLLFSEIGELMFRNYGISGIVTFNASRYSEKGDIVSLDLTTTWNGLNLTDICERYASQPCNTLFDGLLRRPLGLAILRKAKVAGERSITSLTDSEIKRLESICTDFQLEVQGSDLGNLQPQAQRGGLSFEALDPESLQLKMAPNVYAAGEIIDVDGPCGGYNLHWAWASGWAAGLAAAKSKS